MAGTTAQEAAKVLPRKSAKKRSRTSLEPPSNNSEPPSREGTQSPKTPMRQRRRASDFASRRSSSKKRQQKQTPAKKGSSTRQPKANDYTEEDGKSVDEVLRQVRELMKNDGTSVKARALAQALKRAGEMFENDTSGSSSEEDSHGNGVDARRVAEQTPKEKQAESPKTSDNSSNYKRNTNLQKKMVQESPRKRKDKISRKLGLVEEESSSDEADPAKHKAEIEALKKDDPMFYKFLEEHDGSLLDFSISDGSEAEQDSAGCQQTQQSVENGKKADSEQESGDEDEGNSHNDEKIIKVNSAAKHGGIPERSGYVNDVTGYSDDEDDDSMYATAEAEAATEAGFETPENPNSNRGVAINEEVKRATRKRKLIFVDMEYLQDLKKLLKSKRSSLKACKDLLRLFRAGRDILPSSPVSQDKRTKQAMREKNSRKRSAPKSSPELEPDVVGDDVYRDDGSFTSGKVRFASSRSYQQAMNLAIIGIQDALDSMLDKPERKQSAVEPLEVSWNPTDSNRWPNLEHVFRPYVFHLLALCDVTEDADTLRFLLKRLEKLVPYTRENKVLLKKIARIAVNVWSSDPHHIGQTTRLRSYILLTRLAHGPGNTEPILRACCNIYTSKVAHVCNPKTLPLIHFATSCLVELFGIDMGASYTTAFSYLREMAVSLRAVLISKNRNEEIERIHNWSYINKLRLLSKILGRYGSEHELRPLIYPYVQIAIGIMRVQLTPRTIPLRLHVASYLSDLTADTGVFIPIVPQVLTFLRCSELRKKATHGSASALEWRSLLRVSDETVKTKPFLTGLVQGVVFHVSKYFAIISKHVSFPEVAHFAEVTLKKTAKELHVAQWRTSLSSLAEKLRQTSDIITDVRSKADFSPHGAIHPDGMLSIVPGIDKERKMPIQRFFEVELARVMKEERLRDEKQSAKSSNKEQVDDAGYGINNEINGNEQENDSSDGEQVPPSKKRKTERRDGHKNTVGLSVPNMKDSDDEDDEIAELSLNSDESEEEE